jgi:hypothetical protein
VTLIGVKSKYGSCSGNCTGLIKINNIIRTVRSDVLSKLILGVWIFCVRDLKSGSNPDMS